MRSFIMFCRFDILSKLRLAFLISIASTGAIAGQIPDPCPEFTGGANIGTAVDGNIETFTCDFNGHGKTCDIDVDMNTGAIVNNDCT